MKLYFLFLVLIFSYQAFGQSLSGKIAWINSIFKNAPPIDVISVENNDNVLEIVSNKDAPKYLKRIFEIKTNGKFTITESFYHTNQTKPTTRVVISGYLRKLDPGKVFSGTFLEGDSTMSFYVVYREKMRSSGKMKNNHRATVSLNDLELGPINAHQDQRLVEKIITTLQELITSFGGKNKAL